MSRLDFVPSRKQQEVNLEKGTLRFTPVVENRIDFRQLVKRIEDAGYKVRSIEITITGKLMKHQDRPAVEDPDTGQVYLLNDSEITRSMFNRLGFGATARITGDLVYDTGAQESIAVKQYAEP